MELNNCLVTKLNADIENNSIPRLNHIKAYLSYPSSGYPYITIANGKKVTITDYNGHSVSLTGNGSPKVFEIRSAVAGEVYNMDISDILEIIDFDKTCFGYNIGEFWSYRTETTSITLNNNLASGSIEDLGKLILLKNLNISSANAIVGEVKTLASKLVENGRESDNLAIYYTKDLTGITYNGVRPPSNHVSIKFGTSMSNPTETDTANGYQVVTY